MALTNDTQTFDDTPTPIGTAGASRRLLGVRNPAASGATLYVGGPDVTPDNATFLVAEGDPTLILTSAQDSLAGEAWHGVCDTGETATDVAVTEG